MKNINFGIIGCGIISDFHAKAIEATNGATLIGVADINYDRAMDFAEKCNAHAYETVEQMLSDKEIDAVCICTPSGFHADPAIKAIRAKKHVIIEKPLSVTNEDCDRIIAAADEEGVCAGVITQYRFSDAIHKLKELISEGKLGKIISAELIMKYNRTQEYYDSSSWRGTWKLDGGSLMNQGIHGVDALLYVMGDVVGVSGYTKTLTHTMEAEDTACVAVEFKNGALGLIHSTTSVYKGYPRNLIVSGTKGTVSVKDDYIDFADVEGMEGIEASTKPNGKKGFSKAEDIDVSGHVFQISDFVDAINNNRDPIITLREAKKDVTFINAVYESARTGKKIIFTENK